VKVNTRKFFCHILDFKRRLRSGVLLLEVSTRRLWTSKDVSSVSCIVWARNECISIPSNFLVSHVHGTITKFPSWHVESVLSGDAG